MRNIKIKTLFILTFFIAFSLSSFSQDKTKDPVSFREFIKFLVDIKGFEGNKPEGQNISMGNFKASEAERTYKSDEKTLEIKIADYTYYPMMKQGLKMLGNFEVDSSNQLVKKINLDGFTAILEIKYDSKKGQIIVFMENSIIIVFSGKNITKKEEIISIAKQIDLKGLSKL
jgi:hypothetical protein